MQRFLSLLLLWLVPLSLWADGKVFRSVVVAEDAVIPDQRALLSWSGGVERLVIETSFLAKGSNLAWVVPLPNPPVVEAATPGVFPTLQVILRPQIRDQVRGPGWLLVTLTGWIYLIFSPGPWRGNRKVDVFVALASGAGFWFGFASLLLAILTATATGLLAWHRQPGGRRAIEMSLILVCLFLLMGLLLPVLATAGGASTSTTSSEVTVLSRQRTEAFDTVTLTAKEPRALLEWLNGNGYAMSSNCLPVIASYLSNGWVFAATQLRQNPTNAALSATPPISFTFPSVEPVYPLRLTGIGNGRLKVDLFVFGPERAAVTGFRVVRCDQTEFPEDELKRWPALGTPRIAHPLLRRWLGHTKVVTRLQADLTEAQMTRDAVIRWEPFRPVGREVLSRRAALALAANQSSVALFGGLLLLMLHSVTTRPPGRRTVWLALAAVFVIWTGLRYQSFETVTVRVVKHRRAHLDLIRMKWTDLVTFVHERWQAKPERWGRQPSAAFLREETRAILASMIPDRRVNPFTADEIREEDSPGNYRILESTNGAALLWYGPDGREYPIEPDLPPLKFKPSNPIR